MATHHKYSWKKRRIRPAYTPEQIAAILHQLSLPSPGRQGKCAEDAKCFCGEPIEGRNLCSKHYQWAWVHAFI
jgi:hypothetical protein